MQQIADRSANLIQLSTPSGSDYLVSPDGKLMIGTSQQPAGYLQENRTMSEKDLLAKARARLDERSQSSLSEDQLIIEEMKHRLQRFFDSNEADAMKLVKAVMTKSINQ
ncbi:MAG: hypothetical protein ACKOAG_06835 [Candidatus Kapaibacterium sp.]